MKIKLLFYLLIILISLSCANRKENNLPEAKLPPLPEKLDFAGENVDLHNPDIKEAFQRELISNVYYHSGMLRILLRSGRFFPEIEAILKDEGLPQDLKYIAVTESMLSNAISPMGARGFWQFMDATARDYGLRINSEVDERYNLEKSTRAACIYLAASYKRFGSWALACAAYNAGNNRIRKAGIKQRQKSFFDLDLPSETMRYYFRILALKTIMENPRKYNYQIDERDLYQAYQYREIQIKKSIPDLVDWAIRRGTTYRDLIRLNPWLLSDSLTVRHAKGFTIRIRK